MATTKTFNNVRLQLKYDTYANWTTNNPKLLAGEVAITIVPTKKDGVEQVPATLIKVGDGENTYNDLPFVSGLAANVHDWAMAAVKPEYKADEITGLADYIAAEIQDSNTTYQVVKVDDYTYKLQYKELNGAWTDVAENGTVVIPKYDDTQVKADIAALQTQIGTGKVEEQIQAAIEALKLSETYDEKGAAATALTNAKAYTDQLANGAVKGNTDAIAAIKDGTTLDSFADVESALEDAAEVAKGQADQALVDAKAYTDELKNGEVAAAAAAASAAQGSVDALAGKVGTVAEGSTVVGMIEATQGEVDALEDKIGEVEDGKTVVEMIEAAQTAATYDDTQVKADIKANADAIAANKTDIEGKLAEAQEALQKSIEQNATAIETLSEGIDAEKIDGVKDLIKYVEDHGPEVTGMKGDITQNATDIDAVEGRATALEGRMDTAEADIDALEKDSHVHTNFELLETYTQTEANLADAVAKKHAHANATVLDGIDAEDVAAWDGAVTKSDALEAAMGEVEEGKTLVEMIEAAKEAAIEAATYDDTEVRGLVAGNTTEIGKTNDRVAALEKDAVLEGDTLILNCGTSAL